jgi:hypothetical protein
MISKTLGTASRKFARLRSEHEACGLFAQALYPLLVASADDFGRFQADAFTVKHSVWSTAPENERQFEDALKAMADEGLIRRADVDGQCIGEIVGFDQHQHGLHKRTDSRFPQIPTITHSSGNFPEIPGHSPLRELNLTEGNLTEEKGKGTERPLPPRPKTFGRITLHRWQLDELITALGPHAAGFALDEWVDGLSAAADQRGLTLHKDDVWPWVQAELKAECQRRGFASATAAAPEKLSPRLQRIAQMERELGGEA